MNTVTSESEIYSQRSVLLTLLAIVLGAAGVAAAIKPELGAVGIIAIAGVALLVKHIELALPIGIFLVYINSPVIAAQQGIPKSLVGIASVGLLAVPVVYRLLARGIPIRLDATVPAVVAFTLVQFLGCVLMAANPDDSLKIVITTITEGLILFVLVSNAIYDRRGVKMTIWAVAIAGGIMGAAPLHQYTTGNVLSTYGGLATMDQTDLNYAMERGIDMTDKSQYGGRIRLAGVIGEKNRFAQILVMVIPLCAALFMLERGPSRYAAIGLCMFVIGGIVVSFSRGAIAGFGGALFAAAIMKVIRWRELMVATLLASAVVLCQPGFRSRIVALGAYAGLPVSSISEGGEETSVQGRLNEMTTAFKVFSWNPVLGVGPGMFGKYYEEMAGFSGGKQHAGARRSHNLFLNIAAEHGLLGLLSFGAVVVGILSRLYRARFKCLQTNDNEMATICTAMIVLVLSYLGTGMFLHFAYVRYFWMMMGVAAATAAIAQTDLERITGSNVPTAEPTL